MTVKTLLTAEQINDRMNEHWGSEQFYRHSLMPRLIYTSGMRDIAQFAECYWLIDMVASYIPKVFKENTKNGDWFNLVRLSVKENDTASFSIKHDRGENAFIRQQIDYTTMPKGSYEFYLIGDGERYTLLLKQEY